MAHTPAAAPTVIPTTEVDPFSHDLALDPYPTYRALRDQAAAVFVEAHDFWIVTRYAEVRAAAADWESYTSARGVALLDRFNEPMLGTILASDPPEHDVLRGVLSDQLAPRALRGLREEITQKVATIVDAALARGRFDAASELAWRIPVQVVSDLLGLPEEGRDVLLPGADASFTTFGPDSSILQERMAAFEAHMQLVLSYGDGSRLREGSWGSAIHAAADHGQIDRAQATRLMRAFLVAGMDTTANALSSVLQVLAARPDVWAAVRVDRGLIGPLFEEAVRTESPVQGIFRVTTREVKVGEQLLPPDARVMLHFGAANRDERKYPSPDEFVVDRNPLDHLGFGYGTHTCAGQGLARMEAHALLGVLLDRVDTLELVGAPVRHENPIIRGLESLPVSVRTR